MDAFENYFAGLRNKSIAVLGLGVSNRPLVRLLLEFGCQVTGCDKTPRDQLDGEVLELEKLGCKLHVGPDYLEGVQAEILFRTPGMHPNNPAIEALRQRGAQVTSEMEVFFEVCPCNLIAVTGSDGKTTTTTLVSEMLKASGKTVWLGGNIGTPLLPLCRRMKKEDFAVVELSSFQLHSMKCKPDVAVITNVSPNHLDKHKDYQDYIDAKSSVFAMQDKSDRLVLNHENEFSEYYSGKALSHISYFSRVSKPQNGVFCTDGVIYRVHDGEESEIMRADEIKLPGVHNLENYMAAFAATDGYVSNEVCVQTAKTFNGVEHRLEQVRVLNGVTFINDSIGTSPTRTAAGLHALKTKPILIAGGYDKHLPFDGLGDEICKYAKALYLTGATTEKIYSAVTSSKYYDGSLPIFKIDDFRETVLAAAKAAEEGDIVLLSPACAAFDKFKNFMQRGKYYKEIVMELPDER